MTKYLLWMVAAVVVMSLAQAVTLQNTTLNATGSNTVVTFTGISIDVDLVTVGTNYVSLHNATVNNSVGHVLVELANFTTANTTTDSAAFPVLASLSSNAKSVTSGISFSVNASVNVSTSGLTPSTPRITYPNGSSEYPSYLYDSVGGTITFNATIQPGVTTIELNAQQVIVDDICTDSMGGLGELASWLPIIALVVAASVVFGALYYLQNGTGTLLQVGSIDLSTVAMVLVGTAIVISVGVRILQGIIC